MQFSKCGDQKRFRLALCDSSGLIEYMSESEKPSDNGTDAITGKPMPEASPAATIIIFRDMPGEAPPEILMVERSAKMAFAAGAAVFPGGRVDEADFDYARALGHEDVDEYAARIAAIREAIEETGIAVGVVGDVTQDQLQAARHDIHANQVPIKDICERYEWSLDLESLTPWSRWKPPFAERRVFDTRFYLVSEDDDTIEAIVDETENYNLFWSSAQGVIDKAAVGEIKIIFPTRRNLERLALFKNLAEAEAHAAEYPVTMVSPHIEERNGKPHLCIPEGIGYPVTAESFESVKRG